MADNSLLVITQGALTGIADAIRTNMPNTSFAEKRLKPSEMASAINHVWVAGHEKGYEKGLAEAFNELVPSLAGLTWTSYSYWLDGLRDISGIFYIDAIYEGVAIDLISFSNTDGFRYHRTGTPNNPLAYFNFPEHTSIKLDITGGSDATNPELIEWFRNYGLITGYGDIYTLGYEKGYEEGHVVGYDLGFVKGEEAGYQVGYTDGKTAGAQEGYKDGYNEGYSKGEEAGYSTGRTAGYQEGFKDGKAEGQGAGYEEGYAAGKAKGEEDGYANGYQDGYTKGYGLGHIEGFNDGYAKGEEVGYGKGHSAGYAEALGSMVTTLKHAQWRSKAGWTSTENLGTFNVKAEMRLTKVVDGVTTDTIHGFITDLAILENNTLAYWLEEETTAQTITNEWSVFLNFFSGTDLTNSTLISWLIANGTLSGVDRYDQGYSDGYDEGYNDGYDEGYIDGNAEGYDEGHNDGYNEAWEASGIDNMFLPLAIQAQNTPWDATDYVEGTADDIMFGIELFDAVSVGQAVVDWRDYIDYDAVSSSSSIDFMVNNNTDRIVYVYVCAECDYTVMEQPAHDTFYAKIEVRPHSSTSKRIFTKQQGYDYSWDSGLDGLRFI